MSTNKKLFEYGGIAASIILVAFGIAAIVLGINGRSTVHNNLSQEAIVGTPDMTPSAIKAEAQQAKLPSSISLPSKSVAGETINTGSEARVFAQYMRIHALEATGGLPYAQLPRFATADGKGTNDATKALTGKGGQPLDNPVRQVWITQTALSTALNASFLAENVALFGIVVGIALLLTGLGFGVLVIGGSLRGRENAFQLFGQRRPENAGTKAVPVV